MKDGHLATIFRACAVPVSQRNFFSIFIFHLLPSSLPFLLPILTVIFLSCHMSNQLIYFSLFMYLISGNPLMPELNPSAQRCLTIFSYWGFCFLNRAFR
jgi:hypothetical protein